MPDSDDGLSDRKAPGFWFFTADFEKDVQILSLPAQGLWIRMLCWMHENEAHRGFLELQTGAPMDERDIANRVGRRLRDINPLLAEMARSGTYSRDARGCIFSRRMARDTHISETRRAAAKSRANKAERAANGSFAGSFAPAKSPAKPEQNPTVPDPDTVTTDNLRTHTRPHPVRATDMKGVCVPPTRLQEFLDDYPDASDRDSTARQYISMVTADQEAAVFACLARYRLSDQVSRGVVMAGWKWLQQQGRNNWAGVWPPRKNGNGTRETTYESITRVIGERIAKDGKPW